MRPAALLKRMGAAVALVCGIALTAPVALAQDPACVQACADQWAVDKAACQTALDNRLAELDTEAAACLTNPDPIQAGICVRNVNIKRFAARRTYQQCVSQANTTAFNCYRACAPSGTRP